jgi:hypothetical protein
MPDDKWKREAWFFANRRIIETLMRKINRAQAIQAREAREADTFVGYGLQRRRSMARTKAARAREESALAELAAAGMTVYQARTWCANTAQPQRRIHTKKVDLAGLNRAPE